MITDIDIKQIQTFHYMKKLLYILLISGLSGSIYLNGQTIVNEGDDLIQAITDAEAGSEIVLMSGVHVANSTEIPVSKSLTIRGDDNGAKPLVYLQEIGVSGTDINLTIEGIEFSGATFDTVTSIEDTTTLMGDYLINLTDTFVSGGEIIIRDCIVRNLTRSVIRGDRADNTVESILVDDCIVFDLRGGSSYGPFRLKSRILFDEFTIQNSTFHHIRGPLIDCQDMLEHEAVIEINHCTFYKWGGIITGKYLFDIQDNTQASISILNSILGQTNNTETTDVFGFRLDTVAYKELSFSIMTPDFTLDASGYDDVEWDRSDYAITDYEVNFTDAETSDFSIPHPDDLYEMSDEGTLIGDPRWSLAPDALDDVLGSDRFNIFPIPARDQVFIMNTGLGTLEIYNSLGVIVDRIEMRNASLFTLDISGYHSGVYYIKLGNSSRTMVVY